jgi:hypothetical protein
MDKHEIEALQTIFSNAYVGLKNQNWKKSGRDGSCYYYYSDDLKCAIGHSIPQERYTEDLELDSACSLEIVKALNVNAINDSLSREFRECLRALQLCHDDSYISERENNMQQDLKDFAAEYKLNIPNDDYQITYL